MAIQLQKQYYSRLIINLPHLWVLYFETEVQQQTMPLHIHEDGTR